MSNYPNVTEHDLLNSGKLSRQQQKIVKPSKLKSKL